jgi:hypothetical protein
MFPPRNSTIWPKLSRASSSLGQPPSAALVSFLRRELIRDAQGRLGIATTRKPTGTPTQQSARIQGIRAWFSHMSCPLGHRAPASADADATAADAADKAPIHTAQPPHRGNKPVYYHEYLQLDKVVNTAASAALARFLSA